MHRKGQYYRAFTAMWLHANFVHIFFNMIALLIVGPAVEVLLGKVRFLVLYLIAGLGGSVALLHPRPAQRGGHRSVRRDHGRHGRLRGAGARRRLPMAPVVGLLVLNFLIGFSGNIDWRAHLGGLVTGGVSASPTTMPGPAGPTAELAVTLGASAATSPCWPS